MAKGEGGGSTQAVLAPAELEQMNVVDASQACLRRHRHKATRAAAASPLVPPTLASSQNWRERGKVSAGPALHAGKEDAGPIGEESRCGYTRDDGGVFWVVVFLRGK